MSEIPRDPLESIKQNLELKVISAAEEVSNLEVKMDKMFEAVDASSVSNEPIHAEDGTVLGSIEQVEQGAIDSFSELSDKEAGEIIALMEKSLEIQLQMKQSVIATLRDIYSSSLMKDDKLMLTQKLADELKNRTRSRFANVNLPEMLLATINKWLE